MCVLRIGLEPTQDTLDAVGSDHVHLRDQANRGILGPLPRGNKVPPLLTDFLETTIVPLKQYQFLEHAKPGARLPDSEFFPKGLRLLQVWSVEEENWCGRNTVTDLMLSGSMCFHEK